MVSLQFCSDELNWLTTGPNSTVPLPSWCFQHAILVMIPPVFFLLCLPIIAIQLHLAQGRALPTDWLAKTKQTLTLILLIDKLVLLARFLWEQVRNDKTLPLVEYVGPIVQILTLFAILKITICFLQRGVSSVGVIFCSFLLFVLTGLPEFYVWLRVGVSSASVWKNLTTYRYIEYVVVWYPLVCLQFVLQFFTIRHEKEGHRNPSPESQSSFASRQFVVWFGKIVKAGKRSPLSTDDLFDLDEEMESKTLASNWDRMWKPAVMNYKSRKDEAASFDAYTSLHTVTEESPLLKERPRRLMRYGSHGECEPPSPVQKPQAPSIIVRLIRMFKWQLVGAMVAKLASDLLQYANPLLLGELINFTEDPTSPIWKGVGLAMLMFGCAETRSVLMNNYLITMLRTGAKIQSILTLAVYQKALKLSNSARQEKTVGEIVNLMAIDVDRFQSITPQIQQFWSSPFSMTLAMVILFQTLGWAAVGGVVVLLLLVPANMLTAIKNKKWQVEQMKWKDERLKLTGELLNGIRVVKLNAWEEALMQQIDHFRGQELCLIKKAQLTRTIVDILNVASPFLVALIAFTWFTLSSPENILTSRIAFVSLTVFAQLRQPLFIMAELIGQTVQTIVSNRRLKTFLVANEIDERAIRRGYPTSDCTHAIDFENATFVYTPDSQSPALNCITLRVKRGQLVAVIGEIGSGKSSLLDALLGEIEKTSGFCSLNGTVGFVAQRSWIQNLSLRENILFNKPYNEVLYRKVIEACALETDIKSLPDLDETEIGERGINLSGGQQARVSLARALYRQTDILLLDDLFSAVDALVGRTIFEKAIGPGSLSSASTRILVTHSQYPLPFADLVVVMKNGEIVKTGTYEDLAADPDFLPLIHTLKQKSSSRSSPNESENADRDADGSSLTANLQTSAPIKRVIGKTSSLKQTQPRSLITEEYVETTRVKRRIYFTYIRSMTLILFFSFALLLTLNSISTVLRNFWLSNWSDNAGDDFTSLGLRLGVFAALGVLESKQLKEYPLNWRVVVCFMYGSNVSLIFAAINSSLRLHSALLGQILHCPISFFDSTPVGRILNRFGKDMETVDLRLSSTFRFLLVCILNVTSTIVVISISTPLFVLTIIPLAVVYAYILVVFIPTSRQLQRLTSVTISPLYSSFSETLQGLGSIRAYSDTSTFYESFREKLDLHIKCKFHSLISRIWLGVRLEVLGNLVILSAAMLAVLAKRWGITSGLVGISISYSLNMTFMLNFLVRSISDVETNVVAVERIREYSEVEQELSVNESQLKLPHNWPTHGSIVFRRFSARYRPGLENCLNDLNVEIRSCQKVGIVGRTGAGKSSFTFALFRLIQPMGGKILIDGINIQEIELHALRSRISCIPQDPVLFSGSLRFNLDPLCSHTDDEIWSALEDVHLKSFVQSLPDGLSYQIAESGGNISVGQRQLICMARAILRGNKIIVFDEATASVDVRTDQLIQKTIREKFVNFTVLTVAHRTETIIDYDKIIVLTKEK